MNWKPAKSLLGRSLLLLACFSVTSLSRAETNAPPNRSSRYLFLVDTSTPMKRRATAVQTAVDNLLRSSMAAQLDGGDTIAVWTFDEQLHTGQFPLQVWSPESSDFVASNVVAFLKNQKYQSKTSNFEAVVPALNRVVQGSYRLTVLLVSDGNERIAGTPFDRQIEGVFAQKGKEQEKARMPFITVLRSMRGQYRSAIVNLAPWPVEFPEFPPEPKVVEAPKPVAPAPKPTPRPLAPPLILSGKKPPATNEPPAQTNAPLVAPATGVVVTNVIATEPVPPTNPPTAQPEPGEAKSTAPTAPAPVMPEPAPSPVTLPATNAAVAPSNSRAPSVPAVAVETQPAAPSPSQPNPSPAKPPSAAATNLPVANMANTEVPPTNPPEPVVLAVKPEPGFMRLGLLGIGIALALLSVGLFFIFRSRARHATGASLITRSMDRDQHEP